MTDLNELSRLLKQATPGPWLVDAFDETGGYDCMYGSHDIVTAGDRVVLEIDQRHFGQLPNDHAYRSPEAEANAALIAALRNHAEALIRDARRYRELVMAVGNKWPGETRHETALRYIRTAEVADRGGQAAIAQEQP